MIGALGACFGKVVTLDSPRARSPGEFNWESTLWHEMAHVVALQMSNQRVPRWLTEGAVDVRGEAGARRLGPRPGSRVRVEPQRGDVLSLRDLNGGFSRPETISIAYFQASVLVEHMIEAYGESTIYDLLRAYGDGLDTEAALAGWGSTSTRCRRRSTPSSTCGSARCAGRWRTRSRGTGCSRAG